jgi:ferredoxin
MIVAERKPMDEILAMLEPYRKVLVLGCGSCVTVCLTGGEKQADELASLIRLACKAKGQDKTVEVDCITRQCDREFFAPGNLKRDLKEYDAVLSIACGVGVGFAGGLYPQTPVLPGLNTTFYGAGTAPGTWEEYCHGCGDCVLAWTGGICPMARCSKYLINGTCGGTNQGKCEVKKDMDCGWYLIYKRLSELGRLDEYRKIRPARDWRKDRASGQRRLTHQEMIQAENEAAAKEAAK